MRDDSPTVDLVALEAMTTTELARRYESLFGERCRSSNKQWLLRRVAWREQFLVGGDLTARAMESARSASEGIACDADIRVRPPSWVPGTSGRKVSKRLQLKRDPRIPPTGSVIRRVYRGEEIAVKVLDDGFEFEGGRYRSLTAVATAITGSHWNGRKFFGLDGQGDQP